MSRLKRHTLAVEIAFDFNLGQRQAQDKLCKWLEAYGYTASGFGFEFKTVGVITGKHLAMERNKDKANGTV